MNAAAVYTDGGVVCRNPSAIGGVWAWVTVDADGRRLGEASGGLTAAETGLPAVSNNLTELLAAVCALEALPAGWGGTIYTDSFVTLTRVRRGPQAKLNGVPQWLRDRLAAAKARAGEYSLTLLGGHPSRRELAAGRRADGTPVSVHNVRVDALCGIAAKELMRRSLQEANRRNGG